MSNIHGKTTKQTSGASSTATPKASKEFFTFLNNELDRLHAYIKNTETPPDVRKWAMDRTKELQEAIVGVKSVVEAVEETFDPPSAATNGNAHHDEEEAPPAPVVPAPANS